MDIGKRRQEFFRRIERPRSGLDILSEISKSPQDFSAERARQFAERARAVPLTWDVYRGTQQLRAWEALALFHELDPAVLGLTCSARLAYIETMAHTARRDGLALLNFLGDLQALRLGLLSSMPGARQEPDPIQVVVELGWFRTWAADNRLVGNPQATRGFEMLTIADPTPRMRILARVHEQLYTPVARGGTFDPAKPGKLDAVRQALTDAGIGSKNLAKAAATILARSGQGPGRPSSR